MNFKLVAAQTMRDGEEWVKIPLVSSLVHVTGGIQPLDLGAFSGKSYGSQIYPASNFLPAARSTQHLR